MRKERTSKVKNYHRILGVRENATEKEIKHAYRKLAQGCHPDKAGNDPILKKKNEERFKEINEAYQVLGLGDKNEHLKAERMRESQAAWAAEETAQRKEKERLRREKEEREAKEAEEEAERDAAWAKAKNQYNKRSSYSSTSSSSYSPPPNSSYAPPPSPPPSYSNTVSATLSSSGNSSGMSWAKWLLVIGVGVYLAVVVGYGIGQRIRREFGAQRTENVEQPTSTNSASRQQMHCAPSYTKPETITLIMPMPHGRELGVSTPDGRFLYIAYRPETGRAQPLITSSDFLGKDRLRLTISSALGTQANKTPELIFTAAGTYEFIVSDNLETEDDAGTFLRCKVNFMLIEEARAKKSPQIWLPDQEEKMPTPIDMDWLRAHNLTGKTIEVHSSKAAVMVKNFFLFSPVFEDGTVLIREGGNRKDFYQISYVPDPEKNFDALYGYFFVHVDKPDLREKAEKDILDTLSISRMDACKLDVRVQFTDARGKRWTEPLSFCATSKDNDKANLDNAKNTISNK